MLITKDFHVETSEKVAGKYEKPQSVEKSACEQAGPTMDLTTTQCTPC